MDLEELRSKLIKYRCIGLIDRNKTAHKIPFGLLRKHIVDVGRLYFVVPCESERVLKDLGFEKHQVVESVWSASVSSESELEHLCERTRRLKSSDVACIIDEARFNEIADECYKFAFMLNPRVDSWGITSRLATQASKVGNSMLMAFNDRSDVFRVYFPKPMIEWLVETLSKRYLDS
jgi:hypothetical protein